MQKKTVFSVSWDRFHRDSLELSRELRRWELEVRPRKWSAIVAVARGGLAPALVVATALNIRRIETVSVASYGDDKEQGVLNVLKPISRAIVDRGGDALVIDDLVDTGKTARLVRDMLPECHYATLYAKPQGRPMVDTFITEVSQDTWIYFPWEEEDG